ncbi:hypothetical protein DSM112329_01871 [Paraconexibacter sp. AEG42_29]|uniref:HTH marR-type domain-containing protein n=1 Tax=Paraconexibacter sp. AEG42_29 TaxID=2997339 RepID=A0AAU7ATR0_9ACTN
MRASWRRLEAIELPVVNQAPHRSTVLVVHLARRLRVESEAAIAHLGMRSRHLVALTVLRDQHGSTQQALATTLGVDRTNLVGLLNELEAEGLIARRRSAEDRRRHIVELTPKGGRRLAKAEYALAAVEDRVLAALDSGQRETLYALLHLATSESPSACMAADADDAGDC